MIYENTPTLYTERLILRKFTIEDAAAMYELLSDIEVNKFLPWFPINSIDEAKEFIRVRYINCYNEPSAYRYAICLKENNCPIGYVGASLDDSHDFGYALAKKFWGVGIVAEASRAIIDRMKICGYNYITATHDVNNSGSGRVMQKLDMKYKYSYHEICQPKNIEVVFRLYQFDFCNDVPTYSKYSQMYKSFVEDIE